MAEPTKQNKLQGDLKIQQKVYDLLLYAYPVLEQFPKSQKFGLAADIKRCCENIMRLVISANMKYHKKTTLQELDIEVAVLKIYIRMAYDLKYLKGQRQYEHFSGLVVEVGKMVGGWIKSARSNERLPDGQVTLDTIGQEDEEVDYQCSKCGEKIPAKAKRYSEEHFGAALCYKCQRKLKETGSKL